jgi:hypothetical protein
MSMSFGQWHSASAQEAPSGHCQTIATVRFHRIRLTGARFLKRTTVAIGALVMALVGTNAAWTYLIIDRSITQSYTSQAFEETNAALNQALVLLPLTAKKGATRAELIAAVQATEPKVTSFEKDGFVSVGRLGLKFDDRDRLIEVVANN